MRRASPDDGADVRSWPIAVVGWDQGGWKAAASSQKGLRLIGAPPIESRWAQLGGTSGGAATVAFKSMSVNSIA